VIFFKISSPRAKKTSPIARRLALGEKFYFTLSEEFFAESPWGCSRQRILLTVKGRFPVVTQYQPTPAGPTYISFLTHPSVSFPSLQPLSLSSFLPPRDLRPLHPLPRRRGLPRARRRRSQARSGAPVLPSASSLPLSLLRAAAGVRVCGGIASPRWPRFGAVGGSRRRIEVLKTGSTTSAPLAPICLPSGAALLGGGRPLEERVMAACGAHRRSSCDSRISEGRCGAARRRSLCYSRRHLFLPLLAAMARSSNC
jgi:hypothetical protein